MEPVEDLKDLVEIFEGVRPEQVVFWTGAGISCASPTNLPDGDELTEACMRKFMPEGVPNYIKNIFRDFYKNPNKEIPRLELIIQNVYDVLGQQTFNFFVFMNIPNEHLNSYHWFFAQHILAGGTHFTMNFDTGIENAMKQFDENFNPLIVIEDPKGYNQIWPNKPQLIKLHGSLTNKDKYSRLGLILRRITGGFGKEESENILKIIQNDNVKILCFIGYSGRDVFDVTPFFLKYVKNARLNDFTVVWIKHAENKEPNNESKLEHVGISEIENDSWEFILKKFEQAGAQVWVDKGDARTSLILCLRKIWNFKPENKNNNNYKWRKIFNQSFQGNPVQHYLKKLIAGECAQSLGLGQLAVDCSKSVRLCNLDTQPSDGGLSSLLSYQGLCWYIYTDGLRNLGMFGEAITALEKWKQIATKNSFDDFLINARLTGEYRLRGNALAAHCYYTKAESYLKSGILNKFTEPEEEQLANDFIARLYVDYLEFKKGLWDRLSGEPSGLLKLISKRLGLEKQIIDMWIDAYYYNEKGFRNPHTKAELEKYACIYFEGIGYKRFFEEATKKLGSDFDEEDLKMGLCSHKEENAKSMQEIEAFFETDSLLGVINSKRWLIDRELSKQHYNTKDNIEKIGDVLIFMAHFEHQ